MRRQQPEAEKPGPARYHQYLSSKDDRTGRRCIKTSVLESGYTGDREDTHTHTETVIDEKRVQTLLSMTLARHPNFSVYTQVSKADLFDFFATGSGKHPAFHSSHDTIHETQPRVFPLDCDSFMRSFTSRAF